MILGELERDRERELRLSSLERHRGRKLRLGERERETDRQTERVKALILGRTQREKVKARSDPWRERKR